MTHPAKLAALLLIASALLCQGGEVKIGDSYEATVAALGEPTGKMELKKKTRLLYPRGEIILQDGTVTKVDLMDDKAFASKEKQLRTEQKERTEQQAHLAADHTQKGETIKAEKLKSPAFAALHAKSRLDFWKSFQIRYPEVDVSEQITKALESYKEDADELMAQQEIAEAKAKEEAAENTKNKYNYGYRNYNGGIIYPHPRPRPPIIICPPAHRPTPKKDWNYTPPSSSPRAIPALRR